MEANIIMRIKPELMRFLEKYDFCFGRITARRHLDTYIEGQLGPLERKSVEPIADAAGVPPRTLQNFLGLYYWDEAAMRDRLQQHIARHHAHPQSVGVIDETSFVKKGDKTACVQRQHCGCVGKKENCVVSVHLGYAVPGFHTMLDGELFLPEETWHANRQRCRQAGIPDEVVYRPKHQIAFEQYQRSVSNGIRFGWLTFDEFYGRNRPFLRSFDHLGQNYVAEVPVDFTVWTQEPQILYRAHHRDKPSGRPRKYPRLKVKNNPRIEVRNVLAYSPVMRKIPWEKYHVKDGSKGPMVWETKHMIVWFPDDKGLPTRPYHLIVARNALNHNEVKYFISNAPPNTELETLLKVAFCRWAIERVFEDSKGELGMDHFEVRKYPSIQRHLILSCVSHVFLSEFCQKYRGGKSRLDCLPGADGHSSPGATLVSGWPLLVQAC